MTTATATEDLVNFQLNRPTIDASGFDVLAPGRHRLDREFAARLEAAGRGFILKPKRYFSRALVFVPAPVGRTVHRGEIFSTAEEVDPDLLPSGDRPGLIVPLEEGQDPPKLSGIEADPSDRLGFEYGPMVFVKALRPGRVGSNTFHESYTIPEIVDGKHVDRLIPAVMTGQEREAVAIQLELVGLVEIVPELTTTGAEAKRRWEKGGLPPFGSGYGDIRRELLARRSRTGREPAVNPPGKPVPKLKCRVVARYQVPVGGIMRDPGESFTAPEDTAGLAAMFLDGAVEILAGSKTSDRWDELVDEIKNYKAHGGPYPTY